MAPEIPPDIHAAARRAAERITIEVDSICSRQHRASLGAYESVSVDWVAHVIAEEWAKVFAGRLAARGYANRAGSTTGEPHAAD